MSSNETGTYDGPLQITQKLAMSPIVAWLISMPSSSILNSDSRILMRIITFKMYFISLILLHSYLLTSIKGS